jgi:flavin-dependent dehydrogenase/geranylgeranyl pyrophosphate synthase
VLLVERSAFPRDKACGDGLTRCAVDSLAEMGVIDELAPYQGVAGVRIHTDTGEYRDSLYPLRRAPLSDRGMVVPRLRLDEILAQRAQHAGAVLWQQSVATGPVMTNGRVCGINVHQGHVDRRVNATFVIAADGSTSAFASKAGLLHPSGASTAYAVRGYFADVGGLDDLFSFYLPIHDGATGRMAAGYGWVFKLPGGVANVGVGLLPAAPREPRLNLRAAFDCFTTRLRTNRRFAGMTLVGQLRGGPLSFGLDPSRSSGKGVLVVGDAAGLVDPLSGEGISSALESGKLAADVLTKALGSADPTRADLTEYSHVLRRRYANRHQRGREHVRSYGFLMRLIKHTFAVDSPVINSLRGALLDDGAPAGSYSDNHLVSSFVSDDLMTVRRLVSDLIGSQFPLLSELCAKATESIGSDVRIQLAALSSRFGRTRPHRSSTAALASAIELAHLAVATHRDVLDERVSQPDGRVDAQARWGNVFTMTAGDFLLVKAYTLAARIGPEVSQAVSEAIAKVYSRAIQLEQHAATLPHKDRLEIATNLEATFYELPCRLGATIGGAPPHIVASLSAFGHSLGLALSILHEAEATASDRARARRLARRAQARLRLLPDGPAHRALADLAALAVSEEGAPSCLASDR